MAAMLAALALAVMTASAASDPAALWPAPFPPIGRGSAREALTAQARKGRSTLGLNGLPGLEGETISKALVLLPKKRANAGMIAFELESGQRKGIHACEALGRGATSREPKPGWVADTIEEPGGRKTPIYYAPIDADGGATLPGIYELRNIAPPGYDVRFLNKSMAGEEALLARMKSGGKSPHFSGVYKTWFPRDPRYASVVPIDLLWSQKYQPQGQGAAFPIREHGKDRKDPEQLRYNPRYYFGPYGRYGFAVHTDRWDDPETAADPKLAARDEFRSFLFRDTEGCLKVRPDCLALLNAFVEEQSAKGRRVLLEAVELP